MIGEIFEGAWYPIITTSDIYWGCSSNGKADERVLE